MGDDLAEGGSTIALQAPPEEKKQSSVKGKAFVPKKKPEERGGPVFPLPGLRLRNFY
jgi:hypothetical protein